MQITKKAVLVSLLISCLFLNTGCLHEEIQVPVDSPVVETDLGGRVEEVVGEVETGSGEAVESVETAQNPKDFKLDFQKRQAEIQANHPEKVKIFLTLLNDKGDFGEAVGCGDSVVGVLRTVDPDKEPVQAALEELFSIKNDLSLIKDNEFKDLYEEVSGMKLGTGIPYPGSDDIRYLYNALEKNDLIVDSIFAEGGNIMINITGEYSLGGSCDGSRFVEQIKQTLTQFDHVQSMQDIMICINDKPLEEFSNLSGMPIVDNYCRSNVNTNNEELSLDMILMSDRYFTSYFLTEEKVENIINKHSGMLRNYTENLDIGDGNGVKKYSSTKILAYISQTVAAHDEGGGIGAYSIETGTLMTLLELKWHLITSQEVTSDEMRRLLANLVYDEFSDYKEINEVLGNLREESEKLGGILADLGFLMYEIYNEYPNKRTIVFKNGAKIEASEKINKATYVIQKISAKMADNQSEWETWFSEGESSFNNVWKKLFGEGYVGNEFRFQGW